MTTGAQTITKGQEFVYPICQTGSQKPVAPKVGKIYLDKII